MTSTLTHAGSIGLAGVGQGRSWIDWAGSGDAIALTFFSADRDYLDLRGLTGNSTRMDAGIADLEVTRNDGDGQRWQRGMYLEGAWRSTVQSYSFASAAQEGVGIELEGQCVDCYLVVMHLSSCDTSILLSWATEGTVIQNAVMVGPRHGLRGRVNEKNRKGPWFTLRDSHCNSSASAVEIAGTGDSWVSDNLFYKTPGSSEAYVGVRLTDCRLVLVTGNEINNISAEKVSNAGIVIENFTGMRVEGNTTVNLLHGAGIRLNRSPDTRVTDASALETPTAKLTGLSVASARVIAMRWRRSERLEPLRRIGARGFLR